GCAGSLDSDTHRRHVNRLFRRGQLPRSKLLIRGIGATVRSGIGLVVVLISLIVLTTVVLIVLISRGVGIAILIGSFVATGLLIRRDLLIAGILTIILPIVLPGVVGGAAH